MLERIIVENYKREQAGYKREVAKRKDCNNTAEWENYIENLSVYKSMLGTYKIGDSTENLDMQLREVCKAVGREDFDGIKEVLSYDCHSFLVKKTLQDSKGYTDEGKELLKANKEKLTKAEVELQRVETALAENKKIKNDNGEVLSKTAMKDLVETLNAEIESIVAERKALFASAIYKATTFKEVSDGSFRRTFETVYASMVHDNGKILKEWFEPTQVRLGKYWSDLKKSWEKCGLEMADFWEYVTRAYRDGDRKSASECKARIKEYKAEQKEKEKAEKAETKEKPVDKMNKAELIAKGVEMGLQFDESMKNKEMVQAIKAEKERLLQETKAEVEEVAKRDGHALAAA